jgi:hypothetical protein
VRANFILHPELAALLEMSRAPEPENALVESTGSLQVPSGVADKGKLDDFHDVSELVCDHLTS